MLILQLKFLYTSLFHHLLFGAFSVFGLRVENGDGYKLACEGLAQ